MDRVTADLAHASTGVVAPVPKPPTPEAIVQSDAHTLSGSTVWIINGVSKLDDSAEFCVFSPEFQIAEHWFKMQFFPSGGGRVAPVASAVATATATPPPSSEVHCSLYLFATRHPTTVKYSLSLLPPLDEGKEEDPSGVVALYECEGSTKHFASDKDGWGFYKWYPRDRIIRGVHAKRDQIRIRCTVSIGREVKTTIPKTPGSMVLRSPHDMVAPFEAVLISGDFHDAVAVIECMPSLIGVTPPQHHLLYVPLHRVVLFSRSPYFKVYSLEKERERAR